MNWILACNTNDLQNEEVVRFDHGDRTYAIYCGPDGNYYATDGLCSHEAVHLADGFVMDFLIECPKHNGQFDFRTGQPKSPPVCRSIAVHPVKVENDCVFIGLAI